MSGSSAEGLAELLRCNKTGPSPSGRDIARAIVAARSHGLVPLLYQRLRSFDAPASVLDGLRRQVQANSQRNLYRTAELLRILRIFEGRGIIAVPFKGPLLAQVAYGSLASRQFNDLDIVVREDEARRAQALLIAEGYRPLGDFSSETSGLGSPGDRGFCHRERRVVVELHWRLFPRHFAFRLQVNELWDRLQDVSLAGMRVRTFAPEDLLLILCAHGAKHCWERLAWVADVAALIRTQPSLDWTQTLENARRLGGTRMLILGVVLARELGNAPIPEPVAGLARSDTSALGLAAAVRERFARETSRPLGPWGAVRFHLSARERFADRARYVALLALTPTSEDVARLPLPAMLSFLYFALRPLRLVGRYALELLYPLCVSAVLRTCTVSARRQNAHNSDNLDTTRPSYC